MKRYVIYKTTLLVLLSKQKASWTRCASIMIYWLISWKRLSRTELNVAIQSLSTVAKTAMMMVKVLEENQNLSPKKITVLLRQMRFRMDIHTRLVNMASLAKASTNSS